MGPQQAGMWWVANLRGDATVEQFVETYNILEAGLGHALHGDTACNARLPDAEVTWNVVVASLHIGTAQEA